MLSHTIKLARLAVLSVVVISTRGAAQTSPSSALSVHGYLTQGYGASNRDTVMGLTREGTTDYRRAAIVARYTTTPRDHFVVQIGHRRLGESPTMRFEDNLKVDMAFYEHRFDFGSSVRIGKSVLPYGIFNEVRYVGTLLPFYRAPFSVYFEGQYTSETIDGIAASHRFRSGEPWEISTSAYAGTFDLLEFGAVPQPNAAPVFTGARMQAKNVLGGQLWVATPVDGLRLGFGGRRADHYGGLFESFRAGARVFVDRIASVDLVRDSWQLRAETARFTAKYVDAKSEYVQLSVSPVSWITVNAQSEFQRIDAMMVPPSSPMVRVKVARDDALGVSFTINPQTVLKLERHRTNGFNVEQVVDVFGPRLRGSYFISSLSVSF